MGMAGADIYLRAVLRRPAAGALSLAGGGARRGSRGGAGGGAPAAGVDRGRGPGEPAVDCADIFFLGRRRQATMARGFAPVIWRENLQPATPGHWSR